MLPVPMLRYARRSMRPFSQLRDIAARLSFSRGGLAGAVLDRAGHGAAQAPEDQLFIPICEESPDDSFCRQMQLKGQFLARQDRWEELSEEILTADRGRMTSPAGTPVADLLAWGGRADVIRAVEHALGDSGEPTEDALLNGIRGLEAVRAERPDDPAIALIVALAHIDIGWAWRGPGDPRALDGDTIPSLNRDRCAAHFERAAAILHPWCGDDVTSPALAAAHCALLAGQRNPEGGILRDYERLIDLDRANFRPMRALGTHLLPRWFGSYAELDLQARRIAARTQDIWGDGGYTWVCFDAIALDEGACAELDVEFFLDGLRDIVAARPDQGMINLLAAYCALALPRRAGRSDRADAVINRISAAASWLIRDHMTELHPMIWAHAACGFDNNTRVTSPGRFAARGRDDALRIIAEQFRDELRRGRQVVFTDDGVEIRRA
ncbi:hypothetical protein [Jhaorihella thermophila]|uniref:DUF4034 domain-containing protein n=2 Tax=Jhaorihella thermophila TaxID=488547 RepID=A0A1H5S649_9RHOB|nr:hypothetical protein [Jhaorihella thermophila]SEF46086.1 hypothetical protein SAMN05421751_101362 [Jhaorihella thermophila]